LAHNNSADSPTGRGCAAFAAAIAADPILQNVISIAVYNEGALGDELATLQGCLESTIEMTCISSFIVGMRVPMVSALDIPFLFRDVASARAALDSTIGAELAAAASMQGVHILAWGESGLRHITANRPIRVPADLAGLRMRVPQSEIVLAGLQALGASARQARFQYLYEMLHTGEFDGQENPIGVVLSGRLYEVQKYLSLTAHIYAAYPLIAGPALLNDLSDAQRAALRACALQATVAARQAADAAEQQGLTRLRSVGMTVVEDVDRAAFQTASKANLAAMRERFGGDLITRLQQTNRSL
jgi:tripartite ATP-independent transporter DctP family solute receptor